MDEKSVDGQTIVLGNAAADATEDEIREARTGAERAFRILLGALRDKRVHPADALNGMMNLTHSLAVHLDPALAAALPDSFERLHAAWIVKHTDA